MPTATWTVTKQMMSDTGTFGGGAANPGDLHIPIGKWDPGTGLGWITRATLYAPINFSGMTSITSAFIYLRTHTASGWHANGSGTKQLNVYRKTSDWSETSHGSSASIDELWGGNGSAVVNGGWVSGPNVNFLSADTADNTLAGVDITSIAQAWLAGSPNYGIMLFAGSGETSATNSLEFYSRHASGKQPYIEITYATNQAPLAPFNLQPTGSTTIHLGSSVTLSGDRNDFDPDDHLSAYQVQVWNDAITVVYHDSTNSVSGGPNTFAKTVSGLPTNVFLQWRARTADMAGAWGPFSGFQRFKLNSAPNLPTIQSPAVADLTPTLAGSFFDADPGDSASAVNIEVYRVSDNALMWATGDSAISGSSWSKTYAGTALSYGVQYRWRARVKDANAAYSGWSGYVTWTTSQPAGPTLSPRNVISGDPNGGKKNDTTPDLTITHTETFTDHEVFVYSNEGGTTQVFTDQPTAYAATTSKVITVSPALTNGGTYYWKARVLLVSTGQFSQWAGFVSGQSGNLAAKFYINALPTAPTSVQARTDSTASVVMRDSDGVQIVTKTIPLLEATYNDPDLGTYGDLPSARQIEIYNDSTGTLVHSNENLTPAYTQPMRYWPGTASGATTTLAAAAALGATNIKVTSVTSMAVNDYLRIEADTNASYEVVRITAVGTAGSGGTGVTLATPLAFAHNSGVAVQEMVAVLSNETTYKMRWRFQDNSDTYGAWSEYTRFKVTQESTLTSVTPTGTVTSPAITCSWNHSSPGGKSQGKARVMLMRDSDSITVFDSGFVSTSTESMAIPVGHLVNGESYTVTVEAVDTDGV